MPIVRFVVSRFFVGWMILGAVAASGQSPSTELRTGYPNKPIRILTSPAGGGADFVSRTVADGISGSLGQPIIVDNRSSNLIAGLAAVAPPDGYTWLIAGGTFLAAPLFTKTSYDAVRDFSPVSSLMTVASILVVHSSLPVKSVKELIALAKAKPGELNFVSGSTGGSNHIASALFSYLAGVNIVLVPYQGSAQSIPDLLNGVVQMTFESANVVMPHVKTGRLRALAVTTAKPSALFPELPTVAASLPGFEQNGRVSLFVPAKTPAAIIVRLNQEAVRLLNRADVKEKFLNRGIEPASSSPEELAAAVKLEISQVSKIVKDAGVTVDR